MLENSPASTQELERAAIDALAFAKTEADLEEWRVKYLGRRGEVSRLLRSVGTLPPQERREAGASLNRLKSRLTLAFDQAVASASQSKNAQPATDTIDVTLPGRRPNLGGLHPSEMVMREILQVFNDMGFQTVEGPIVELEKYNFDMLNVPADHPARDLQDTLWINRKSKDRVLLRTQTSPMQVRTMEKQKPPVRIVSPGLCFRHEATDATHEWQFHQIEGLAVDEGVTMSDLKGTLYEFARRIFGTERKIRFRCDYFPFVEPGGRRVSGLERAMG